ncbi:MAG: hypothetical protein KDD15_08570 [Lewinella sp.]|nr:hypothetical protein [Lewinella sp.]
MASPYFNKNQDLLLLVEYLEAQAPEFREDKVRKETVFKTIFPGEPFDKRTLAYLMNYLLKLGERFLALQNYEKEDMLMNCHILDQYVERKLDKHYNYLFNKAQQTLEEKEEWDGTEFYYKYLASQVATKHFYSKQVRKFDPSLQSVCDELDEFYFFHKLKYSCEMLSRQTMLKADYHLNFVEEVKNYLLQQPSIAPLTEIYLYIYLSYSFPDEEQYFEKLMGLIDQHAQTIGRRTRREIYLYAINYCAPKTRKGIEKYFRIVVDLYVKGIENKSLFDGIYLSHWTYTNVVRLALRIQRHAWVEVFIKEHVNSLVPAVREDAGHYNLAELYFHKGNYDQVLTHLNQLHFSDLHYHLGSRVILLKTYFEMDADESLLSLLAAFSVYLRRNKDISLAIKKNYLNFCYLLNQVMRRNLKKWEILGDNIRQMHPLAERGWLLQVWERTKPR